MSNSIKTNFSAMTALQSLNMTNKSLEKTQSRISTGFKVNEAADNAAYWAIASNLRSDNSGLSTVQDSLGLGAGLVDVAYTAVNKAKALTDNIKEKLISALQPGVDIGLIQIDIDKAQEQLKSLATSAAYSGQNWLVQASTGTTAIVSNYSRDSTGAAVVDQIVVNFGSIALFEDTDADSGLLGTVMSIDIGSLDNTVDADRQTILDLVDAATVASNAITESATNLGALKAQISSQKDFIGVLRDAIDRGVSSLVDADMNEESTRLSALQVQQQLGVQALSIANQSSQSILRLFQ